MRPENLADTPLNGGGALADCFVILVSHVSRCPSCPESTLQAKQQTPAYLSVLSDSNGTCSSKHALLAALSHELHAPIRLMMGIYEMEEANTPGVGCVLDTYGVKKVHEAHLWVEYDTRPFDLNSQLAQSRFSTLRFLHREEIQAGQTVSYKTKVHRRFIAAWLKVVSGNRLTPGEAREIRAQYIEALLARDDCAGFLHNI